MTVLPLFLGLFAPDTAASVTRAQPAWLWTLEGTAALLVTLCLCGLLAVLVVVGWRLNRAFERLGAAIERFRDDLRPVSERTAAIADHLERAAATIRENVEDVSATVREANESLRGAVATAGERLREFDAIVRVARDEAEGAIVSATSVMRGVRTGMSALRRRRPAPGPAAGSPHGEPDAEDGADGDAGRGESPPSRRRGGPRIRHEPPRGEA